MPRDHALPSLLQLHCDTFLHSLSLHSGRNVLLDSVPDEVVRSIAELFDVVYLLGVWTRGQGALAKSLAEMTACGMSAEHAKPSPFAVAAYEVDRAYGGPAALQEFRKQLRAAGLRLMLDFVPNHWAVDHEWTRTWPHLLLRGSEADLGARPGVFFRASSGCVLAHGGTGEGDGWTDTVQINYAVREARAAMKEELLRVSDQCDGVRCDMAMLALSDVFARGWRQHLAAAADSRWEEFWPDAIAAVLARWPDFLFVAEAYWGTEQRLCELGFHAAYDKAPYDHLAAGDVALLRAQWCRDASDAHVLSGRRVRFLENHDERRAAAVFGALPEPRHAAAAVALFTTPCWRFVHHGQVAGCALQRHLHCAEAAREPVREAALAFYTALLRLLRRRVVREGGWLPLEVVPGADGDAPHGSVLAHAWRLAATGELLVVAVNCSPSSACARVRVPSDWLPAPAAPAAASQQLLLQEVLDSRTGYVRKESELREGLWVLLQAWQYHVLDVRSLHASFATM